MTKEFNLSEKIVSPSKHAVHAKILRPFIITEDVKLFIKKLKEPCVMKKRKCKEVYAPNMICSNCNFKFKIDKLAGEELVK